MDPRVTSPQWGGPILWYVFLGGIAAGAYAVAALAVIFGSAADRRATRPAFYLAFPLVCVCGLLLTVDPDRPGRSWHTLVRSPSPRTVFRWWSPTPVGTRALAAFWAVSGVSFLGVLAEDGGIPSRRRSDRPAGPLRRAAGTLFAAGGAASALVFGSYTGVLLTTTRQPVSADSTWLGALFLASAASTGAATLVVLARWLGRDVGDEQVERLERADGWAIVFELAMIVAFALTLKGISGFAFMRWPGMLIPLYVVPVGLVLPLILRQARGVHGAVDSALLVLLGGFILRVAVVGMPQSMLLVPR